MNRKLRAVKSEFSTYLRKKNKFEKRRTGTPLRFSRRLRQLPPEDITYFNRVRERLTRERLEAKQIISKESSTLIRPGYKNPRIRRLRYPHRVENSKEVISILSAPKFCNKKQTNARKVVELSMRVRGSSCRPKAVINKNQCAHTHSHYTLIKNIKKERPDAETVLQNRKQFVLEVLNKGDMKDIEKLHSVGSKTAERIILYRQIKGHINRISELAKMPKFPKRKFNNFVQQNYLKRD